MRFRRIVPPSIVRERPWRVGLRAGARKARPVDTGRRTIHGLRPPLRRRPRHNQVPAAECTNISNVGHMVFSRRLMVVRHLAQTRGVRAEFPLQSGVPDCLPRPSVPCSNPGRPATAHPNGEVPDVSPRNVWFDLRHHGVRLGHPRVADDGRPGRHRRVPPRGVRPLLRHRRPGRNREARFRPDHRLAAHRPFIHGSRRGRHVPRRATGLSFLRPPSAGLDSHFYSASAAECDEVRVKFPLAWLHESGNVFGIYLPDLTSGQCPANTIPVYRSWNARSDSNHRYTTSTAVHDAMVAQGAVAEGYGPPPRPVAMCAPIPANVAPPSCVLLASSLAAQAGATVLLSANCSGNPTAYNWTGCTSAGPQCTVTSAAAGTVTYSVVAINAYGASAPSSVQVAWSLPPPPPPPVAPPVCTIAVTAESRPRRSARWPCWKRRAAARSRPDEQKLM